MTKPNKPRRIEQQQLTKHLITVSKKFPVIGQNLASHIDALELEAANFDADARHMKELFDIVSERPTKEAYDRLEQNVEDWKCAYEAAMREKNTAERQLKAERELYNCFLDETEASIEEFKRVTALALPIANHEISMAREYEPVLDSLVSERDFLAEALSAWTGSSVQMWIDAAKEATE